MTDKRPVKPTPPAINLRDIYYVMFRHKWKISIICGVALVVAIVVKLTVKVPYQSEAKLYIRYVIDSKSPGQMSGSDSRVRSMDERAENVINTEMQILTSFDLAQQVADAITPQRILSKMGGGTNRYLAATVIQRGLLAEVPHGSSVIRIMFQHPDIDVVQPVLRTLILTYVKKHDEIHRPVYDEFLTQETDTLRSRLLETEDQLRKAMSKAGIISIEDTKKQYTEQLSRIQEDIFKAQAELAERRTAVDEIESGLRRKSDSSTNGSIASGQSSEPPGSNSPVVLATLPAGTNLASATSSDDNTNDTAAAEDDSRAEHKKICVLLETLQKKEQELLIQFTPANPMVKSIQGQIESYRKLKHDLEDENPALLATKEAPKAGGEKPLVGPAQSSYDIVAEKARVAALLARMHVLNDQMDKIRQEAASVEQVEGPITELQRKKEVDEARYRSISSNLDQARLDERLGSGRVWNINTIQEPCPPYKVASKIYAILAMIVVGGLGLGLGLAFLLELYLDQTVKRPEEIEAKFGLPLFLTIPDVACGGDSFRLKLPWRSNGVEEPPIPTTSVANASGERAMVPDKVRDFCRGLGDRLITFFEVNNLVHKPKLVGLASCRGGAGVTTIASGLAASLSETGEGRVLLVDMRGNGSAHAFYHGAPACDIDDALEADRRHEARSSENLYVVSESGSPFAPNGHASGEGNGGNGNVTAVTPRRFRSLMPRLRASDYDYIIFDMPPISQISVTPALARFMDALLVVVEAETTDRDVVKKCLNLVSDSRANLGVVFNKSRNYLPDALNAEV
jgi:uncharacterized protein involved in exopolysaccharide biosynthesis/Mrp family chromosome partitioning ATPase